MRRTLAGLVALVLVLPLWAADPWKSNTYQNWTEADVKKILGASPWAVRVSVPAAWLRTGAQGLEVGYGVTIGAKPDPTRIEDSVPVHDKLYDLNARFILRWASSRVIRSAEMRQQVLKGKLSQAAAEKELAQAPREYIIHLIGDPLAPFPIASEGQLQSESVLKSILTGEEVGASRVTTLRRDDGQILEVFFYFPRQTRAGKPLLSAQDRKAEFLCAHGLLYLRAPFDLSKMVFREERDL